MTSVMILPLFEEYFALLQIVYKFQNWSVLLVNLEGTTHLKKTRKMQRYSKKFSIFYSRDVLLLKSADKPFRLIYSSANTTESSCVSSRLSLAQCTFTSISKYYSSKNIRGRSSSEIARSLSKITDFQGRLVKECHKFGGSKLLLMVIADDNKAGSVYFNNGMKATAS